MLCDLQQRVPHEKQIVWPSEEQRPRLCPPKRCSQLREQKQKRQEEEQITKKYFEKDLGDMKYKITLKVSQPEINPEKN